MVSMVLGDSTLESLTTNVNALKKSSPTNSSMIVHIQLKPNFVKWIIQHFIYKCTTPPPKWNPCNKKMVCPTYCNTPFSIINLNYSTSSFVTNHLNNIICYITNLIPKSFTPLLTLIMWVSKNQSFSTSLSWASTSHIQMSLFTKPSDNHTNNIYTQTHHTIW
jgi:hypothetical protein